MRFASPLQAQQAGISTVYQEVNLCPNLSVAENIFIGREPTRFGRIQWKRMRKEAAELVDRLGLDIDVTAPLSSYPLAVQQLVAIVRSVGTGDSDGEGSGTKVLVLDEPTSSLDRDEVLELFRLMRQLRDEGVAILFVSHFLDQIYEICDRMTVLRNGTLVGEHMVSELDQVGLIQLMIGKALDQLEELHEHQLHADVGETLLQAEGLGRTGGIAPFDLEIKKGEVVGLAGLLGSGRTELARLLFGADQPDSGKVTIGGKQVSMSAPNDAIGAGVAFCSENRKTEGLVPDLTVRENIILALQAARGWTRPIPAAQRDELVAKYIKALDIRPANPEARVRPAQRRQPAEGAARPLADHPAEAADPGRADARHRRRREGGDPEARGLALRGRHVRAVHRGRAGGGTPAQPHHRSAARPQAGGASSPTGPRSPPAGSWRPSRAENTSDHHSPMASADAAPPVLAGRGPGRPAARQRSLHPRLLLDPDDGRPPLRQPRSTSCCSARR